MIINKRIPFTYPFNLVKWDLFCTLIFSITIHFFSKYVMDISLPIPVAAFLGTAIALVLSFKLSQSYDRWWEARKIWGAIVNDSRTLIIQIQNFTNDKDDLLVKKVAYRQIGWCYALAQNLRKLDTLKVISGFVTEEELESLEGHSNVPMILLNNQGKDIRQLLNEKRINDFQHIQLDATIVRLVASMGMAERIKSTIFPKPYRLTLQFFIYLFLIVLSFSLTELDNFIEIPLLVSIALPFFLLEKIAYNMQDPFENKPTDTAMTTISRTIEINIKQLLDEEDIPSPLKPEKFYAL